MPPASVRAGETYFAATNMTVRENRPDENNRSAPTVTVVVKGRQVKATGAPVRAGKSDQYWLPVSVIPTGQPARTLGRVYPQFAVRTSKADDLVQLLASHDYKVERAEILKQAEGMNEVRYCHDGDSAQARALAAEVKQALGRPIAVEKLGRCASTAPGTLELWVGEP